MSQAGTRSLIGSWGGRLMPNGQAAFHIWAPGQPQMALRIASRGHRMETREHRMEPREDGWFSLEIDSATAGSEYMFLCADGMAVPDPAARRQARDVHGPSELVDPENYRWQADGWRGRPWEEAVIYELHTGAFTEPGTFRAAMEKLDHLVDLGATAIELMPVAQFAGRRGWGYDGVYLYAPHNAYGSPDELKALIDAAHLKNLMVILDVVYNHFGPEGNYLAHYAPQFFHLERHTPWGAAIAYEQPPVRAFIIENALYWVKEYRFDGLRLDAIDQIDDVGSSEHILVEIARRIRAEIIDRPVHLTTEDNRNITNLHERAEHGAVRLYTAEWNDDFHNAAHCLATGESDAYYADFAESSCRKLARALAEGFAFQGEKTANGNRRGSPSGHLPPTAFIDFLQNHDQVGNRAFGERLRDLASPDLVRALTVMLLLSPHIPLLFMGEEWGEVRPFAFFTDFRGDLADAVREGRRKEFARFAAFHESAMRASIPDPNALATFMASKIDWQRRDSEAGRTWLALYRELLQIRGNAIVPRLARVPARCGRIIAADAGVIAVDWRLDGATLHLSANLSRESVILRPANGAILYASSGADDAAAVPPHTVIVRLEEASSP